MILLDISRTAISPQFLISKEICQLGANLNGKIDKGDKYLCKTLEPQWKNNQRDISSIPAGIYDFGERQSPRFGSHYIVKNVPNRDHILIHAGNFPKDTTGCILVGNTKNDNYVSESRIALKKLREELTGCKNLQLKIIDKT